ncbi:MAG: transglutaminase family protein [Paracoccaceae bacterium]|nr:transglutaminase family protein [Paracoccaceae bacterium]
MLLNISHTTRYAYQNPLGYGLQELRLSPSDGHGQEVLDWKIEIEGGTKEVEFLDQHNNEVWLISFSCDPREIAVTCSGAVRTSDTAGLHGIHRGFAPLWYFQRETPLTQPGPALRRLVKGKAGQDVEAISLLHELSANILDNVTYETGMTTAVHTAEDALSAGHGVCQDHSHIFVAAARLLGFPARYVSGYLMLDDQEHQDASHAWAEAHVDGLGWVGFDVSNGISPDARYVRLATGLDYSEAAPVSGLRFGDHGKESLVVDIQVAQ